MKQMQEYTRWARGSRLDSHSKTKESVILEREDGDGLESAPQKKIDEAKDKKKHQYIPKRGKFYEHDDRTAEDVANQKEAGPKKTNKYGKKDRLSHDCFNELEQAPKSRSELIATYGYDIRNEDGPPSPRRRRRRRYRKATSRGPNKYTRNWEDEAAYSKPPPTGPQRGTKKSGWPQDKNQEEIPPLGEGGNIRSRIKFRSSDSNLEDTLDYNQNEGNRKSFEMQDTKKDELKPINNKQPPKNNLQDNQPEPNNQPNQTPRLPRADTIVNLKEKIKYSDYRGFTTMQQRGVRNANQKVIPPRQKENDFTNKISSSQSDQIGEMEKEISQLNIQVASRNNNQNRQGRLQIIEHNGSKWYSSLRQRALPETNTPPAPVNFSLYPTDYNSTAPPLPIGPGAALVPPRVPVSAAPPALLKVTRLAIPPRQKENGFIQSQNVTSKISNSQSNQIAEMKKEISQLNNQDGIYKGNRNNNQNRQGSVQARLQIGSKLYSSMSHVQQYPSDYANSTAPPPAAQQPLLPTPIGPGAALVPPRVSVSERLRRCYKLPFRLQQNQREESNLASSKGPEVQE